MTKDAMQMSAPEWADTLKHIHRTGKPPAPPKKSVPNGDPTDLTAPFDAMMATSAEIKARLDAMAKAEATRRFKAENEKFLASLRERYGTAD